MCIKVFPLKLPLAFDEFVTIALKRPPRAACLQNIATREYLFVCFLVAGFTMVYHVLPEMQIKHSTCKSYTPLGFEWL